MNTIRLIEISPTELADLIQQGLKTEVENLIKQLLENQEKGKEFLTRKETAEFFNVSVVTIHSWINDAFITPLKMGNRTYFRRSELVERLLNSNKVA